MPINKSNYYKRTTKEQQIANSLAYSPEPRFFLAFLGSSIILSRISNTAGA